MWVGCILALLLRFLLFFMGTQYALEEHLELNSPMSSRVGLREGLFLMQGGSSPYAGAVCRHPPLVLLLFWPLRHAPAVLHFALVAAVDVGVALLLRLLAVRYNARKAEAGGAWLAAAGKLQEPPEGEAAAVPETPAACSPAFVGLSYLLNPFVVASALAGSLQNFQHLAAVGALCLAASGHVGGAAAALALLLYLCPLTPVVLVLPVAYLALLQAGRLPAAGSPGGYRRSKDGALLEPGLLRRLLAFALAVSLLLTLLYAASAAAMGGDLRFLQATVGTVAFVRDLTPNVGIFWYIFIEVFQRYRNLFLLAFHGHILLYPVPLHLRLGRHQPMGPWLHCSAAVGILTLFRPYPTASDFGLMISCLLIQAELIKEAEKTFAFLLSGLLFGLCMFPTMEAVWLTRNAGNANFLYNMTLVINVFGGILLTEWLRAGLRLRRREHMTSFCGEIVQDVLSDILNGAPKGEAAAGAKGRAAADGAEGLRKRH